MYRFYSPPLRLRGGGRGEEWWSWQRSKNTPPPTPPQAEGGLNVPALAAEGGLNVRALVTEGGLNVPVLLSPSSLARRGPGGGVVELAEKLIQRQALPLLHILLLISPRRLSHAAAFAGLQPAADAAGIAQRRAGAKGIQ